MPQTQMNARMRTLIAESREGAVAPLPNELTDLIDAGWVVDDDAVLLAMLKPRAHASRSDFPDLTGYECFVNTIYLDDYLPQRSSGLIATALAIAHGILHAKGRPENAEMNALMSISEHSECLVRFHRARPGEHWLDPDLENYREEAVLVLTD
jgi:hypothetical protein